MECSRFAFKTGRFDMKSKKYIAALTAHNKFLKKFLIYPGKKKLKGNIENFPDLSVPQTKAQLSNTIPSNGFKRSLDDYKWRDINKESASVIAETERKKKRIAPLWNKGSIMYITDATELETLGKKV